MLKKIKDLRVLVVLGVSLGVAYQCWVKCCKSRKDIKVKTDNRGYHYVKEHGFKLDEI